MKRLLTVLFFILLTFSGSRAFSQKIVAVLEFRNPDAVVSESEARQITDMVRIAASVLLPPDSYYLMTEENIEEMLPAGTSLADCSDASCEVAIGRKLNADFLLTGEIASFGGELRVSIKLYDLQTGRLILGKRPGGKNVLDLERPIEESTGELLVLLPGVEEAPASDPEPRSASTPMPIVTLPPAEPDPTFEELLRKEKERLEAERRLAAARLAQLDADYRKVKEIHDNNHYSTSLKSAVYRSFLEKWTDDRTYTPSVREWLAQNESAAGKAAATPPVAEETENPTPSEVALPPAPANVSVAPSINKETEAFTPAANEAVVYLRAAKESALPEVPPAVDAPPGMVLIPAGWFWMGCPPEDKHCQDDERPRRRIFLDAFFMDIHEVTVGEYRECVKANKCKAAMESNHPKWGEFYNWGKSSRNDHPINSMDWDDARDYCAWRGKRLPTEAEYEKALRGGKEGKKFPWDDSAMPPFRYGNYADESAMKKLPEWSWALVGYNDSYVGTSPVCAMSRNPYGLCDISGNVWEWCADAYEKDWYARMPERNPRNDTPSQSRVRRGGSWNAYPIELRAANRDAWQSTVRYGGIGFRCVQNVK